MKVFFDTNVIIEYLIQRERLNVVERVVNRLNEGSHRLCMSAGSFYTILYVVDKYINKELHIEKKTRVAFLRNLAQGLLKEYHVVEHDNESLLCSINDMRFSDLEDSCQLQAAVSAGCQYLLTFNSKDYPITDDHVEIMTPEQFLDVKSFNF
jgi:predicted nucleic acid-binding protein